MLVYCFFCELISIVSLINPCFSQENSIKNVDFNVEQFKKHKTEQFYSESDGISNVIVRRGDQFQFDVQLNNQLSDEYIEVILSFYTKRDKMEIKLPTNSEKYGWKFDATRNNRNIHVNIYIPGNAPVGVWKLRVFLKNINDQDVERLDLPQKIIFLFNPWSEEDAAYFPDQEKLNEYILNERGVIYTYNYIQWHGIPWIFGQFQNKVLDATLFILNRATLTASQRGDIALVSRELTYLMNDDGWNNRGVLQGRWKEPFDESNGQPATKPWEWTGSPPILKQYYESGGIPVRYGQCWVFGGILTTAYRALGIASRPVSNFLSAHSLKRDLTVDVYLNETGGVEREEKIWNFHVWVQAWFSWMNSYGNYLGWQELDATPQELNDGRYQVGPASTSSLSNSELKNRYETDFLYEEVNADEVVWSADKEISSIYSDKVGLSVMTKRYRSEHPEDITRMYKPAENTDAERESYRLAAESLGISPPSLNTASFRSAKHRVLIDIQTHKKLEIGSDIAVKIIIKNPSFISKELEVSIKTSAMYYNGEEAEVIKNEAHKLSIQAFESKTVEFTINPEEYIGKLRDQNTIRIEVVTRNGKIISFKRKLISLTTPQLKIYNQETVNADQPFMLSVLINNPINKTLTGCHLIVEGTRIGRIKYQLNDIPATSALNVTLELHSSHVNKETLVVHFHAKELIQMSASTEFKVIGKKLFHFAALRLKDKKQFHYEENRNNDDLSRTFSGPEKIRIITEDSFECCDLVEFN